MASLAGHGHVPASSTPRERSLPGRCPSRRSRRRLEQAAVALAEPAVGLLALLRRAGARALSGFGTLKASQGAIWAAACAIAYFFPWVSVFLKSLFSASSQCRCACRRMRRQMLVCLKMPPIPNR